MLVGVVGRRLPIGGFEPDASSLRTTTRLLLLVAAMMANWLFTLTSIARPLGLYALVAFALAAYALLGVLARFADTDGDQSALAASTLVWLAWTVAAHLFYSAGLVYEHTMTVTMLLFAATASVVACARAPPLQRHLDAATHAAVAVFIGCLAFPSAGWLPQTTPVGWATLRVAAFLLATSIDDITLVDEPQRARRVVAQNAWLLVVPGADFIGFGIALFVVGAVTHHLAQTIRLPVTPKPVPPFEPPPPPVGVGRSPTHVAIDMPPSRRPTPPSRLPAGAQLFTWGTAS